MSLAICMLTPDTGATPATNIGVDTRPNKSGSNEFLSGTDTDHGES